MSKRFITRTVCSLSLAIAAQAWLPASASAQTNDFCDEGRVMGGCVTAIGTFPWQVSLFGAGSQFSRVESHFCGGTVVAENWVLTAAHCVEDLLPTDPSSIAVFFGSTSLEEGGQVVDVRTVYAHPEYRGVGSDDIALLELSNPIVVQPVALATAATARSLEAEGSQAVVIGWGNVPMMRDFSGTVGGKGGETVVQTREVFESSALLLGAQVPLVDNDFCDEGDDPEAICAGFRDARVDACAGDSGGPLHVRGPNGYVQVGIVSGGTLCVDDGERFSTYTRVSAYEEWIRATMAGETEVADLRRIPDYSLDATFFDEDLITGFTPDPASFPLQAGGYLLASDAQDGCAGFVAEAPDVRITYEAGDDYPLRIYVEGDADTTLLVNQPDGQWLCNDDRVDGDLNPEIMLDRPLTGQYDIWVGTYEDIDTLGDFPQVELFVSELERE